MRFLCIEIDCCIIYIIFFFFNDTATTEIYTLSYTTLFRSRQAHRPSHALPVARTHLRLDPEIRLVRRSEEHTSELQSQSNLVCRLLLEKKKKKKERKPKY